MTHNDENSKRPVWFTDPPNDFIAALVNELRGEILKIQKSAEFAASEKASKSALRIEGEVDFMKIIETSVLKSHRLLDVATEYVATHKD